MLLSMWETQRFATSKAFDVAQQGHIGEVGRLGMGNLSKAFYGNEGICTGQYAQAVCGPTQQGWAAIGAKCGCAFFCEAPFEPPQVSNACLWEVLQKCCGAAL